MFCSRRDIRRFLGYLNSWWENKAIPNMFPVKPQRGMTSYETKPVNKQQVKEAKRNK